MYLTLMLHIVMSAFQGSQSTPAAPAPMAPASAAPTPKVTVTPGGYPFSERPATVLSLPSVLREVSGITISGDGRLFGHNDERGAIFQIDPGTGKMIRQFAVGERRLQKDFEDIEVVGDTFYLVSSVGDLFAFREGRDKENVPFVLRPTGLTARSDVEGLCFDPLTGCLLLACKAWPGRDSGKTRAVYAFNLKSGKLVKTPRFLIDLVELKKRFALKEFRPSGIARHPKSGNFFVISAVGNSILELTPAGKILAYASLPKKYHEQPEGIAFDAKGVLYIANEGARKGTIVTYVPSGK